MNIQLLALSLLLLSTQAIAKAPVWKVSKGDNHLYLGGTIHVLAKSDYPLPDAFDTAYGDSQTLVFETDMLAVKQPKVAMQLMAAMMLRGDNKLKGQLSRETYAKLEAFAERRSLPLQNFQTFSPAGLSLVLTSMELQRLGKVDGSGVDQFFYDRAIRNDKATSHFETIEQQIAFIDRFNDLDSDKVIESMISDLDDLEGEMERLVDAWRGGDTLALEKISTVEMRDRFPKLYKFLLVDRNNNWMTRIPSMLDSQEVEFVLVGALHLIGDHGLVEQLKNLGYTVEQLD